MKRYEVIAIRNVMHETVSFGTAHNEKERYNLVMKALKAGYDFITWYEY